MTLPPFPKIPDIPDDDRHWDLLAERIGASAWETERGIYWIATARGAWVATSLLAGLVLIASITSVGKPYDSSAPEPLAAMLAPEDDVGEALVLGDQPPDIGALLLAKPLASRK